MRVPRALAIGGTDGSGGAGLSADLRTCMALGCLGTSAVTAVIAQNTAGIHTCAPVTPELLQKQVLTVLQEGTVDAVKVGALCTASLVQVLCEVLPQMGNVPLVVDPVLAASSGAELLDSEGVRYLREHLLPRATVITPNLEEASCLLKTNVLNSEEEIEKAAVQLRQLGACSAVITGGDSLQAANDCFAHADGLHWLRAPRVVTQHTRGTGCAYSTAIACYLAQGENTLQAVTRAKMYVHSCLRRFASLPVEGRGPVQPIWTPCLPEEELC